MIELTKDEWRLLMVLGAVALAVLVRVWKRGNDEDEDEERARAAPPKTDTESAPDSDDRDAEEAPPRRRGCGFKECSMSVKRRRPVLVRPWWLRPFGGWRVKPGGAAKTGEEGLCDEHYQQWEASLRTRRHQAAAAVETFHGEQFKAIMLWQRTQLPRELGWTADAAATAPPKSAMRAPTLAPTGAPAAQPQGPAQGGVQAPTPSSTNGVHKGGVERPA